MKKLIILLIMTMVFGVAMSMAMSRGARDANNTSDVSSKARSDSNNVYGYEPNDVNDMNAPRRGGTGTGIDRQQGTGSGSTGETGAGSSGTGTGSSGSGGSGQ
jgi:hypothetical protein